MIVEDITSIGSASEFDICVVGAGPVGIALALKAAKAGLKLLVLESGPASGHSSTAGLHAAHVVCEPRHAAMDVAVCRGLGGTSQWWGGRCVPFDDADFQRLGWPFSHEELSRYYEEAASFFGVAAGSFSSAVDTWETLEHCSIHCLERWAPEINMGKRHFASLAESERLVVTCNATVTQLIGGSGAGGISHVLISAPKGELKVKCKSVVFACGGLETTRLLMASQVDSNCPTPINLNPPLAMLGKGYMGHISGKIADVTLAIPDDISIFDFFLEGSSYARRRFALREEAIRQKNLLNIAFWLDNPPFAQSAHRSGVLSMVWMALAIPLIGRRLVSEGVRLSHLGPGPHRWMAHFRNIVLSPMSTVRELLRIVRVRYLQKPAMPGFIVRNRAGRYALHFHAEHSPLSESSVSLNGNKDLFGVPGLNIHLQFCEDDARKIVQAHTLLDVDE